MRKWILAAFLMLSSCVLQAAEADSGVQLDINNRLVGQSRGDTSSMLGGACLIYDLKDENQVWVYESVECGDGGWCATNECSTSPQRILVVHFKKGIGLGYYFGNMPDLSDLGL